MSQPTIRMIVEVGDGPDVPMGELADLVEHLLNSAWAIYGAVSRVRVVGPSVEGGEDQDSPSFDEFRFAPGYAPDGPDDESDRPNVADMTDDEKQKLVEDAVARGRDEIREDIRHGVVPEDVPDFRTLHDYVDANTYGGLCDGHWPIAIIDGEEHLDVDLANAVQDALDAWIKTGDAATVVPDCGEPWAGDGGVNGVFCLRPAGHAGRHIARWAEMEWTDADTERILDEMDDVEDPR